jgi:hypothetical protein
MKNQVKTYTGFLNEREMGIGQNELSNLRRELDEMLFGNDEREATSSRSERGYLSQEHRLGRRVSPKQRIARIEQVIQYLEDYIKDLRYEAGSEFEYTRNPRYGDVWGKVEGEE